MRAVLRWFMIVGLVLGGWAAPAPEQVSAANLDAIADRPDFTCNTPGLSASSVTGGTVWPGVPAAILRGGHR